jgi:hypothetical protein
MRPSVLSAARPQKFLKRNFTRTAASITTVSVSTIRICNGG